MPIVAGGQVQAPEFIVSLAEAKRHLNLPAGDTAPDQELAFHIATAAKIVESMVGPVVSVTHTQTFRRPAEVLCFDHYPVLEITSVTPYGGASVAAEALDTEDLAVGILRPAFGYSWTSYAPLTVVYVAGRAEVPPDIKMAVLDLVRINWRPQQGGGHSAFDSDDLGPGQMQLGFFVPNSLRAGLQDELLGPVVA